MRYNDFDRLCEDVAYIRFWLNLILAGAGILALGCILEWLFL